MKIRAIGRGGAFAPLSIGNSNFLFEEDGKFMVFDFGTTAPYILRDELGFDLGDIDAVYLTHAHAETHEMRSHVHANISDLRTLPPEIKNKMWLYHYDKEVSAEGFAGFVSKGQLFEV